MPRTDTEPYEQLISEEEVEHANCIRKQQHSRSYQKSSKYRPECPPCDYAKEIPNPSHGASFVKRFIELLLTTPDPWRLAMGSAVLFLLASTGAGRGWISIPGLPQLAEAASVTEVRSDQLGEQIESTVREHCLASSGKAKTYYWNKLRELSGKFKKATLEDAKVPSCKDLGVPEITATQL